MVQVVEGGGGGIQYPFMGPQSAFSAYRSVDFSNLNVEVSSDRMVLREMMPDGTAGDTYVMKHGPAATADNTRLLYPEHDSHANPATRGLLIGMGVSAAASAAMRLRHGLAGHGGWWWAGTVAATAGVSLLGGGIGWLVGGKLAKPEDPPGPITPAN